MLHHLSRRKGVRSLLACALAGVSGLALQSVAVAQTPARAASASEAEIEFDIPAQPLSAALLAYADQAGLPVLFAQEDLSGLVSAPLEGRYTREEALRRLIPAGAPRVDVGADGVVRVERRNPFPQHETAAETAEDIVITGTRIRGAPPAGSNVLSLDRDSIDATGRATVHDVLAALPQNFPGSQNELTQLAATDGRRNIAFGSTVDLRGLGADATLTLVNGRRMAPAGFGNFVDISTLPLSAVHRIEVLADGASATYGSDAVGGVVNIILDNDFEGAAARLRFGGDSHGDMHEFAASQLIGASWQSGHVMLGYDYREREALAAADRHFTADSDLRRYGGTNFSRTMSNPGNIIRISATPAAWAIPEGQDGTSLSESDLIAGTLNFQDINEGSFLLPEQVSNAVLIAARQDVGERIELFFDLFAGAREARSQRTQVATSIVIPESNYWRQQNNLFLGQGPITIGYFFGDDLGPSHHITSSDGLNAALGAEISIGETWRLELVAMQSRVREDARIDNLYESSPAVLAAFASNDPATAFNPFADGSATPASVLAAFTFEQHFDSDSELTSFSAKADGVVFALPAGDMRAALGVETRRERFDIERSLIRSSGIATSPLLRPGERITDAAFVEILAPLTDGLALSASARHETSDTFDATTPKIGLTWELTSDLTVRGTWGLSFKAPQFQQTLGSSAGTLAVATPAQDPLATDGSTGVLILGGSNPDLEPEEAESWTAGFSYQPRQAPGFVIDATYFDIDFANRIGQPGNILAAFRDPTGLETVFFRNPTIEQINAAAASVDSLSGALPLSDVEVIFDSRLSNLASLRVRGVDLSASYAFDNAFGDWTLTASASGLLQYDRMTAPGSPPVDVLSTIFNPVDWRARVGLGWRGKAFSANLAAIYVDSYEDNLSATPREIDAWLTYDARLGWSFDDNRAAISLSVQNLFDEDPPFANNPIGYGFDSTNASPVGRFIALELRKRW